MATLPLEIWRKIFSLLDNSYVQFQLSMVCKSWSNLIRNDPKFSSTLTLRQIITREEVRTILPKWPKLKSVTLIWPCQCNMWSFWAPKMPDDEFRYLPVKDDFPDGIEEIFIRTLRNEILPRFHSNGYTSEFGKFELGSKLSVIRMEEWDRDQDFRSVLFPKYLIWDVKTESLDFVDADFVIKDMAEYGHKLEKVETLEIVPIKTCAPNCSECPDCEFYEDPMFTDIPSEVLLKVYEAILKISRNLKYVMIGMEVETHYDYQEDLGGLLKQLCILKTLQFQPNLQEIGLGFVYRTGFEFEDEDYIRTVCRGFTKLQKLTLMRCSLHQFVEENPEEKFPGIKNLVLENPKLGTQYTDILATFCFKLNGISSLAVTMKYESKYDSSGMIVKNFKGFLKIIFSKMKNLKNFHFKVECFTLEYWSKKQCPYSKEECCYIELYEEAVKASAKWTEDWQKRLGRTSTLNFLNENIHPDCEALLQLVSEQGILVQCIKKSYQKEFTIEKG